GSDGWRRGSGSGRVDLPFWTIAYPRCKRVFTEQGSEGTTMLKFDPLGLVPVVIQDEGNGQVLMVASMNAEALRLTRETGYTHLFSRSRNKLWRKGEESGHVQEVRGIYVNCEENSLL